MESGYYHAIRDNESVRINDDVIEDLIDIANDYWVEEDDKADYEDMLVEWDP